MANHSYHDIWQQVQGLSSTEQLRLLEDIAKLLRTKEHAASSSTHSIMELEGLGQEIWEGIDAQEYVRQERNSWDGSMC